MGIGIIYPHLFRVYLDKRIAYLTQLRVNMDIGIVYLTLLPIFQYRDGLSNQHYSMYTWIQG